MTLFEQKAPKIMGDLMKDFALDRDGAAAILGNLGHECGGFAALQEQHPWSGKGGYGWAQWTGPRRRSYEAYCRRNSLNPASDKANYGYLFVELSGDYSGAIGAVKKAATLLTKVVAFEEKFEMAGIKAYGSREAYAKRALIAYNALPHMPQPQGGAQPQTNDQPPPTGLPPGDPPRRPPDDPGPLPPETDQPPSGGFFIAALIIGVLFLAAILKLLNLI